MKTPTDAPRLAHQFEQALKRMMQERGGHPEVLEQRPMRIEPLHDHILITDVEQDARPVSSGLYYGQPPTLSTGMLANGTEVTHEGVSCLLIHAHALLAIVRDA